MIDISFYLVAEIPDGLLKFAVVLASHQGRWIFCRHKRRDTWEIPGGHREAGEDILETARRELREETGAMAFSIAPLCVYGVTFDRATTYGLLCRAAVETLGPLPPDMEIGEIICCDALPEKLTYPDIQPTLFEKFANPDDG